MKRVVGVQTNVLVSERKFQSKTGFDVDERAEILHVKVDGGRREREGKREGTTRRGHRKVSKVLLIMR